MTVDPALVWAFLTALVAGVTRGFSGFGGALIFVPLVSAAYGPRVAAPSLLVIDTLLTLPFVIPALRACVWRQVAPLAVGAVVAVPAGVWVLGRTDPLVLRWGLALLGLGLLALLASGWRHTGRHRLPTTLAVGAVAGFCGGAAQMSGPAVVAYWLGSGQPSALVRANLFGFRAGDAGQRHRLRLQRHVDRGGRPPRPAARPGLCAGALCRRAGLPRRLGPALPGRRLLGDRGRRRAQPAAVRPAAGPLTPPAGRCAQSLIFAMKASDSSKLA
ncbi:TSUP family transporter [Ancylobacter dichloromethanicus]|uniref:TSUP family transporter n=1 Tax=Ancylobacter dichloromethanicus TaxID=518825 RepID=UPI0036191D9C